jgi:hypothetical protein
MTATLALLADVEQIACDVLRGRSEITAIVGTAVFTVLPTQHKRWPALRVSRTASDPYTPVSPWAEQIVQRVDCWGGDRSTARRLAETVRAVLCGPDYVTHHDADLLVVTQCQCGLVESFDPSVPTTAGAARPRYIVQAVAFVHRYDPATATRSAEPEPESEPEPTS